MFAWRVPHTNELRIMIGRASDAIGEGSSRNYNTYTSSDDYYSTGSDDTLDEATDEWGSIAYAMAVPPAVCAFFMLIGTAFATATAIKWDQNETQARQQVIPVSFGGKNITNCYFPGKGTYPMGEPIWRNLR